MKKLLVFLGSISGLALLLWGEAWALSYHVYTCTEGSHGVAQTTTIPTRNYPTCATNQGGWQTITVEDSAQLTLEDTAELCGALLLLLGVAFGFKVVGRALRSRG